MSAPASSPQSHAAGIEFRDVTKRYGATPSAPLAVDDISFAVAAGTLTTLLGPSRLRQDHDAAHDRRARGAERRAAS